MQMDTHFRLRIECSRIWNDGWGRCLEPCWECAERPIKAHSIQNAQILDKLVRDGHVLTLSLDYHPTKPPIPEFRAIGRNRATTFDGLCAKHDAEIFKRIDTEPIKTNDREHLFLLAYRAATRELHTTMAAAYKVQASYKEAVKLGLAPSDQPSEIGMFAVERMAVAWDTYRYRSRLDEALISEQYDSLHHRVVEIECSRPTIAVSSLFSVPLANSPDSYFLVSLSVLPRDDNRTVAVFSWTAEDDAEAQVWIAAEVPENLGNSALRRRLSRIVLANCENMIFAHELVERLADDIKDRIRAFFLSTMFTVDDGSDDIDVDLFI